ncbi:MAG: hypothetical protein FWC13_02255 [Oscillospiraceae bacterium]|nr:hypothetical protein [Oscillospiraceae bacterium]
MNGYTINGEDLDSVDLKCLLISRGVNVDKEVYNLFSPTNRLNISPLTCNCIFLSDGTLVQLTDMKFHLRYLMGVLSWNNLKLLRYASQLGTPFHLKVVNSKPALFHEKTFLDFVSFPVYTDFYKQKTSSGLPFAGNTVIQGRDWVAFQCLWVCEYATCGKACEFCFSGDAFQSIAKKGKSLPKPVSPADVEEIVEYGMNTAGCSSVQITGGSTYDGLAEYESIMSYLPKITNLMGKQDTGGELLLYITPPDDTAFIDTYFLSGADRIACSLELWDESRAKVITPGKIEFTTRKKHLDTLEYISLKYGPGKGFSNFIIGIEDFETLKTGAEYLSERGIMPSASIWMPMGRPVQGNMKPPELSYYKRVKELFAELYQKYGLEPVANSGLNVCVERDIWNYSCMSAPVLKN